MALPDDGRRLRREQNRQAALVALGELYEEGRYEPSAAEIAERAGLSPRSLFRYFDDVDDLSRAAIEHHLAVARPLFELDVDPDAPLDERIAALVEARVTLHESAAPAARAARVCAHRQPIVAAQVHDARSLLRRQLRVVFAHELRRDATVLPAVDALCTFETHEHLRHDVGLSRARTIATLTQALTTLLDPTGAHPR